VLTEARRIERPHVEDIHALHLSENLKTLETSGLLEVGGDAPGSGAGRQEIGLDLDLYPARYQPISFSIYQFDDRRPPRTFAANIEWANIPLNAL
jgi:hypothetical protein